MFFPQFPSAKLKVLSRVGAPAGSTLCGVGPNNQGLRVRALRPQSKGDDGPIRGSLVVLTTGANRHAATLASFVGKVTTAAEILAVLRQHSPACIHVVNACALIVEATQGHEIATDAALVDHQASHQP